jgi:hypothetical protein
MGFDSAFKGLKKYEGRASAGFISLKIGKSGRIFEGQVTYNAGICFTPAEERLKSEAVLLLHVAD